MISILQRFFNSLVGGFGSGLDGVIGPAVAPTFGVTFGTLPNNVPTPFGGGGGGGGFYGDNNPLGLDVGPVSLNPFVGFRFSKLNGKKIFVPSFDILVSPNAKGTNAIKNLKYSHKGGKNEDDYYYDDEIPIGSIPYESGPSPPPYYAPPAPVYPGPYDQYQTQYQQQAQTYPLPYDHNIPVQVVQPGQVISPIYQVAPPNYQGPPSVYPPNGLYQPDYYSSQPPISPPNPYVHDPNAYKLGSGENVQHHHMHEHTHIHKGNRGSGLSLGNSYKDYSRDVEYNPTIEHLGRQFRGTVPTNRRPESKEETFRVSPNLPQNELNSFHPSVQQPLRNSFPQARPNQDRQNNKNRFSFPRE